MLISVDVGARDKQKAQTIQDVDRRIALNRTTIAALAIQNHMPLFTVDSHFMTIAKHSKLKLY